MFKTNPISHLSVWMCPSHFQGLILEMTAEAVSNSQYFYYFQGVAFPPGIHQEQHVRTTTVFPQFRTWETWHPPLGGTKGVDTVPDYCIHGDEQTDCATPSAFSLWLNNFANTSVWEKIGNFISSKIIRQDQFVLDCTGSGWSYVSDCDGPGLSNENCSVIFLLLLI